MGSKYSARRTDDLITEFISEYNRIPHCSYRRYNKLKGCNVPTWECVARRIGVERWSDLCISLGVVYYYGSKSNSLPMVVISYTATEQKIKAIDNKYHDLISSK